MNLLSRVVSFTAATHITFRHMLRNAVSSNVNIMIRGFATAAGNSKSGQVFEEINTRELGIRTSDCVTRSLTRRVKKKKNRSSPNKATYTFLVDCFCKQDRFDVAYRVLNQMIDRGFFPSFVTLNDVLRGFLRIGDLRNAYEMSLLMNALIDVSWMDVDTKSSLYQRVLNEVTYTSFMNTYLDEGKLIYAEELREDMERFDFCSDSVIYSVYINGLDNKARTKQVKKYLLRFNYMCLNRPILEYHRTLAENCSHDEFKSLVELVQGFNAYDTILKSNYYKPNGIDDEIVYNLFIIVHSKRHNVDDPYNTYKKTVHNNVDEPYNMYKEMVHRGFACHMFTLFALIHNLRWKGMINELRWVIQNVLRSCNLNDSEILKFLDEYLMQPGSESFFNLLAEKAKDGLFLKCSYPYPPPSA